MPAGKGTREGDSWAGVLRNASCTGHKCREQRPRGWPKQAFSTGSAELVGIPEGELPVWPLSPLPTDELAQDEEPSSIVELVVPPVNHKSISGTIILDECKRRTADNQLILTPDELTETELFSKHLLRAFECEVGGIHRCSDFVEVISQSLLPHNFRTGYRAPR